MTDSNIEWTDKTWNPVRGCTRVSEGCRNCYAERTAARFSGEGAPYDGLVRLGEGGPRWTGKVRFVREKLDEPLRWKKPARIFVNSMSDLFHEGVTPDQIFAVFDVMERAKHHTFQVLTKRPARMVDVLGGTSGAGLDPSAALPNVWLGVSVENQAAADERIPLLLQTPAAVRFLSVEPLLGPVDLRHHFAGHCPEHDAPGCFCVQRHHPGVQHIDWVIVGGESGPGARPCNVEWVRSVVEQCRAAGVKCFVKQLGAAPFDTFHGQTWGSSVVVDGTLRLVHNRKGGDPSEWPEDLRVRQFPG